MKFKSNLCQKSLDDFNILRCEIICVSRSNHTSLGVISCSQV